MTWTISCGVVWVSNGLMKKRKVKTGKEAMEKMRPTSENETRSEAEDSEVEEDMGILEGIFNVLHAREIYPFSHFTIAIFRSPFGKQELEDDARNPFALFQMSVTVFASSSKLVMAEDAEISFRPGYPNPNVPPAMTLPVELITDIFDSACAPPSLLDPYLGSGPMSPWAQNLRFQKGLTVVCRAWSWAGRELLYRDIAIRRPNQLPLLAHVLSNDSTSMLAPMVKKLRLLCFVLPSQHRVLDLSLSAVLLMCTRLMHLVLSPVLDELQSSLPSMTRSALTELQSVPKARRYMITHIELGTSASLSHAILELMQFPNLTLLSCEVDNLPPTADGEPYILPQLEDLRLTGIRRSEGGTISCNSYRSMAWGLTLPALRKLSLPLGRVLTNPSHACCKSFLRKYGSQLRYLAMYEVSPPSLLLCELMRFCPNLEHLVVPSGVSLASLNHRKIVWIDKLAHVWDRTALFLDNLRDRFKTLPRLRRMRILDYALFPTVGMELPLIIPPHLYMDPAEADSQGMLLYPGVAVCVKKREVCRLDMECMRMQDDMGRQEFIRKWGGAKGETGRDEGGEGQEEDEENDDEDEDNDDNRSTEGEASLLSEETLPEVKMDEMDENIEALEAMLISLQLCS
ncbi:hypothetical protein CONPUDRAFT_74952 [Coniophora puteana RWD-64-598 SS2]|uniref:F-box domain-containing protein n=1 Tax=Coniophora puteana (strain RWD-64-598) TaxID=741705 RepID=A0A5M3MG34_CONPW|nr:uncharacterized protein CONPUDRAFT_74952 [Coniophora puteana RWD-64-598 SS2]EIW78208.1 hypothetical protein CONPUDRAFT_74952 [Coniophora puteana RWD-64-598 SS2]